MLQVVDNIIYLTVGDDESLPVDVVMNGSEPYELGEDEFLRLTVRKLPNKESQLFFAAESAPGSNRIIIPPSATAELEPGKYSADIDLIDSAGRPHTIWPDNTTVKPSGEKSFNNFYLTPEVG